MTQGSANDTFPKDESSVYKYYITHCVDLQLQAEVLPL
jgi:hypothetical protein